MNPEKSFGRIHSERIKDKVDPSRIELEAARCKRAVLPLDYGPNMIGIRLSRF